MEKIRKLDARLGQASKMQREMKNIRQESERLVIMMDQNKEESKISERKPP